MINVIKHPIRDWFAGSSDDLWGAGNSLINWEKHKGFDTPIKVINGEKYVISGKAHLLEDEKSWQAIEEQISLKDYLESNLILDYDDNGYCLKEIK
jgi:hypothetical protein|nr:MAG TPA: hypothetical protein [Caudoviricetes sp.]